MKAECFIIARRMNRYGDCDFLVQWDDLCGGAFRLSHGSAMVFHSRDDGLAALHRIAAALPACPITGRSEVYWLFDRSQVRARPYALPEPLAIVRGMTP